VVFRVARPALAPFVAGLWIVRDQLSHSRERVLPSGAAQLLINLDEDALRTYEGPALDHVRTLPGIALQGPHQRSFGIDTAEQRAVMGVVFRPGGAASFFGPLGELADRHVGLEALWGREAELLRERVLAARDDAARLDLAEDALLSRLRSGVDVRAVVAWAACLARGDRVAAVIDEIGWSRRRFVARFQDAVGLAPKRFARVARFARVLRVAAHRQPTDWSAVAHAYGYYDQAHLIHEFREFAGVTPSAYRPRAPTEPSHVIVE
jgi:AraC-like DNA-binding protein